MLLMHRGLIKSALVSWLAKGLHSGMDRKSCREPLASLFYRNKVSITREAHAIKRVRMLFAEILGYKYQQKTIDYGLSPLNFTNGVYPKPYLVYLHGSSGDNKLWPLEQWKSLTETALFNGFSVYLPWGNKQERESGTDC